MQTTVDKDPTALTMTVTTELDATVERTWQLWADPRQLERWWGPPTYPATVVEHDLAAGARVRYFMTSPEGEKFYGMWDIVAVEPT
ncbi:MAG: SRPBCC family protein, partial [Acidimicrobiales bacterium]